MSDTAAAAAAIERMQELVDRVLARDPASFTADQLAWLQRAAEHLRQAIELSAVDNTPGAGESP